MRLSGDRRTSERLRIGVMLDSPDEKWTAMDLVGEKLLERWRAEGAAVDVDAVSIRIPRLARRLPLERGRRHALNADRALARYLLYPLRAVAARQPGMLFHVVDHSYAQLVHVLPAARTGVYCHDIDAFRPFLEPHLSHNSLLRPLAWTLLRGVRSAAVVFHSTHAVGDALERWGVAPRRKLVHAPYGVSREFTARSDPDDGADEVLASLGGRPYVLHVGSSVPRKRLDVLFEAFARLRARHPELRLVQQGASLSEAQRGQMARLGIDGVTLQPPKLDRKVLAGLYRRAAVVLVTSAAEGFGFPVIEALACGAPVVASDIPALREVGGEATLYAPVGDAEAFAGIAGSILAGSLQIPSLEVRSTRAAAFSWERHARTILDTYRDIAASSRRVPAGGLDPEIGSTLSRADWASFDAKRKVIGT